MGSSGIVQSGPLPFFLKNFPVPFALPEKPTGILELHKPDGSIVTNNDWKAYTPSDQAIVVANGFDQFNGHPIIDL